MEQDRRWTNSELDEKRQTLDGKKERKQETRRRTDRYEGKMQEAENSGGWPKNSSRMALVSPFTADLRRSVALVTHFASHSFRSNYVGNLLVGEFSLRATGKFWRRCINTPLSRLTISLIPTSIGRLLLSLLIRTIEDKNNFSKDVNF